MSKNCKPILSQVCEPVSKWFALPILWPHNWFLSFESNSIDTRHIYKMQTKQVGIFIIICNLLRQSLFEFPASFSDIRKKSQKNNYPQCAGTRNHQIKSQRLDCLSYKGFKQNQKNFKIFSIHGPIHAHLSRKFKRGATQKVAYYSKFPILFSF